MNSEQLKELAHKKAREAFVKIDDEAEEVSDAERILKETLTDALQTAMAEVEKEFANLKLIADTAIECVCDCEAQLTVARNTLKSVEKMARFGRADNLPMIIAVVRDALDKMGDKP